MAEITNEKSVKREIKKLLDAHGWFWWMPPANGYGKAGVSDFNAIKNGVFLVIEAKFGYNKPTPAQKAFIESIWAQKGVGFAVSERHLDWLKQWLEAFDANVEAVMAGKGEDPRKAVDPDRGSQMINATHMLMELLK